MKQLCVMIKPASSLCNMRCGYCFYADVSSLRQVESFGLMDEDTTRAVLEHIFVDLEAGDSLTLAFQGGEPTLAGLDYFKLVTALVGGYRQKGIQIQYALQTNGLLLDEAWCAFLKEHHFLVGLSLDGPATYHDANRMDALGKGTFRKVLAAKERLDRFGVEYNILMVLTAQLARHPQQVWQFIKKQALSFVQFVPCLGPMEGVDSPQSLTPERYASFYCQLFDLWLLEFQQGRYMSIKLFDDLINLLAFGQCNACGLTGQCQAQLIVEADGGVYPCDFYVLDQYRAGNLKEQSVRFAYESSAMEQFVNRPSQRPEQCDGCPHWSICGGGCKRMRREVFCGQGGLCGHRLFLDEKIGQLSRVAAQLRRDGSRG